MAVRQRQLVRVTRIRRLSGLCRSELPGVGYGARHEPQMGTRVTGDHADAWRCETRLLLSLAIRPGRRDGSSPRTVLTSAWSL